MGLRQMLGILALVGIAVVRVVAPGALDETTVLLLAGAVVLAIVPLSSLKTFKAGGFELSLESPQVIGAVEGLTLDRLNDTRLRAALNSVSDLLPVIRGARVLWVDDRPEKVLGERRVLRALGVNVIAAGSSEGAKRTLAEDSDFDLLITDVQRRGDSHEITGGVDIHEGVNFVRWLRENHSDPSVRSMPVLFYAAYEWPRLVEFTRPAREIHPEAAIANSVVDMVPKVIRLLSEARATPISAPAKKTPTSLRVGGREAG